MSVPIKTYYDVVTKTLYDESGGELSGNNKLSQFFGNVADLSIQYVTDTGIEGSAPDTWTKWTELVGTTIASSTAVDNNYIHAYKGSLNNAISSGEVLTSIVLTVSISNDEINNTDSLILYNASGESQTIEYTAYTKNGTVYTFTVAETAAYDFAENSDVRVPGALMIKAEGALVDDTQKDTGLFTFTLNSLSTKLISLVDYTNVSSIVGVLQHKILSAGEVIRTFGFSYEITNLIDFNNAAVVPDTNPNLYASQAWVLSITNAKVDEDLSGYTTKATLVGTENVFIDDAGTPKKTSIDNISTKFEDTFAKLATTPTPTNGNILVTNAIGQPYDSGKKFDDTGTTVDDIWSSNKVISYIETVIGAAIILQGDWDADTNTPDITTTTEAGYAWRVSVAGNTDLGGITDWLLNDLAVKTATGWLKIANQDIAAVWGNISGTLENQTDLQDALNLKQNAFSGIDRDTPINVSIDYTTRIVTIVPDNGTHFNFFVEDGTVKRYTKTGNFSFPAFDDISGVWNFNFDENGNASVTQGYLNNYCNVVTVYRILWNNTLTGEDKSVSEAIEWHENVISCYAHDWMHTYGCINRNGFDLYATPTTGVPDTSGVNTCVSLSTGSNSDDCLEYSITNSTDIAEWNQDMGEETPASITSTNAGLFEVRYDVSGVQYVLEATRFPFVWDTGTDRPQYFDSAGTRTLVPEDNYFVYFLFSIQDKRNGKGVVLISAPNTYTTLSDAQNIDWSIIQDSFPIMSDNEVRPLYKLIFLYNATVPAPFPVETKYTALIESEDIKKQKVVTTTSVGTVTASAVSVANTPTNYTAGAANVEAHLIGIDNALGTVGGGGLDWEIITTDTTAQSGKGYLIDASSNTVTLTLPSIPTLNDQIGFYVLDKTNLVTIARNGNNIDEEASDITPEEKAARILVYSNATVGWSTIANNSTGGGGGLTWSVISTNTTAVKDNGYAIDASSGTVTLTLPASPDVGDSVGFKSLDSTNTLTIARNSEKIEGEEADKTLDSNDGGTLVYTGTTYGWVIVTELTGDGAGSTSSGISNYVFAALSSTSFAYPATGITNPFSNASNSSNIEFDLDNYPAKVALLSTSSNEPMQFVRPFTIPSVTSIKFKISYLPETGNTWNSSNIVWKLQYKKHTDNVAWSSVVSKDIGTDIAPSSGSNPLLYEQTISLSTLGLTAGDVVDMVIYVDSTTTWTNDIAFVLCELEGV